MPRRTPTPTEAAAEIVAYYEKQLERRPDDDDLGLGLEMARWWQRLLRMENPSTEEVNRLYLALYAKRNDMGGRWFDLSGRVEKWKRSLDVKSTD